MVGLRFSCSEKVVEITSTAEGGCAQDYRSQARAPPPQNTQNRRAPGTPAPAVHQASITQVPEFPRRKMNIMDSNAQPGSASNGSQKKLRKRVSRRNPIDPTTPPINGITEYLRRKNQNRKIPAQFTTMIMADQQRHPMPTGKRYRMEVSALLVPLLSARRFLFQHGELDFAL
jgi:hypothetical protein